LADVARTLVDEFLTMLNAHDPALVDRFISVSYVNHNSFADGREANRQFWASFFDAVPDLTASMEDFIVSGNTVVGRFVYRGTHAGELLGIPASGNRIRMESIDIWRIEDAVFAEHWDQLNLLEVFQQIGAIPRPGGSRASDE
jgi:steroid delta-isomerase-like uncharacterized protein